MREYFIWLPSLPPSLPPGGKEWIWGKLWNSLRIMEKKMRVSIIWHKVPKKNFLTKHKCTPLTQDYTLFSQLIYYLNKFRTGYPAKSVSDPYLFCISGTVLQTSLFSVRIRVPSSKYVQNCFFLLKFKFQMYISDDQYSYISDNSYVITEF